MQAVLQRDRAAADQVAMLLHSCINEVRGNDSLAASLQLMTRLDALLKQPQHPSPGYADVAAPAPQPSSGRDGGSVREQHHNGATPRAASSERGTPAPSYDVDLPIPPRSDAIVPPGPPGSGAPGGERRAGARGAALEVTSGRLLEEFDGDALHEGTSIACVGCALRLTRLPVSVEIEEVAVVMKTLAAIAIEEARAGEFLVLFEATAAALRAFQVLPGWLERTGWGRATVAFATGTNIDGGVLILSSFT